MIRDVEHFFILLLCMYLSFWSNLYSYHFPIFLFWLPEWFLFLPYFFFCCLIAMSYLCILDIFYNRLLNVLFNKLS